MSYIGDFAEDYATLNTKFTTVAGTGASTVLAGTPVISVYKANGTTQSTAGITLSVDFDSVVGLNNVLIDLSADAFYATGNDYQIVITTGTVDSVSVVGYVIGEFSIENRTSFPKADFPTNFNALGIESDGDVTKVNLVAVTTLTDTTTTNTDMVGTDSALLASSAPTNFGAMGIESDGDITKVNLVANTTLVDTTTDVTNEVTADMVKINSVSASAVNLEQGAFALARGQAITGTLTTTTYTKSEKPCELPYTLITTPGSFCGKLYTLATYCNLGKSCKLSFTLTATTTGGFCYK